MQKKVVTIFKFYLFTYHAGSEYNALPEDTTVREKKQSVPENTEDFGEKIGLIIRIYGRTVLAVFTSELS